MQADNEEKSMNFSVVILAAGLGTRMCSTLPKVLHPIAGTPLLERIIQTVNALAPKEVIVVYGYQGERLIDALKTYKNLVFAHQKEQLGTGHAVLQAMPHLRSKNSAELEKEKVLILSGDVPLISQQTLMRLIKAVDASTTLGFVTVATKNPTGLGRVIRNDFGSVIDIVEEKDATDSIRQIKEINAGIYLIDKHWLQKVLPQLQTHNSQKEYYLTDIIKAAVSENKKIITISPDAEYEVLGVNDKIQLAHLERIFQQQQAESLMKQGVTLLDPQRFDLRGELKVGKDVSIDVNVVIEGNVKIGSQVSIGPNVYIRHSDIHDGVHILANSVIEGAVIGAGSIVGPFARVRPGTELSVNARIGNFVEIKNAIVGSGSKINHLSYIGDATLGQGVNVGAGTITCNYDGLNKHHTYIGDNVFIGSDTQLIAPVKIGDKATIGAGTTIVKDVPPHQLVHNRIQQRTVQNWARDEKLD